ncbi:MAG: response regulator [Rhizobiales bacterium]|nr:response regulator [Rhizobacter sp.]
MCVDDEPNIVSALRRLLRGSGYRVVTATSGAEALALFEREPIDLVISDMRMPGMDGAQLLEQVRARWPLATRLLLTGYADVTSSVAAINRGEVYRYLTKPWNDAEIVSTIKEAFERQSLEREKRRLEALTQQQNAALTELNASLEQKVAARTADLLQANEKVKKNYLASIKAFSNLIELRGGQAVGHARRVADLARRTARALGMTDSEQQQVFIAGLLHDIGHLGLPDTLLARSVPRLCDEEMALYRRHPALGEQALLALDDMQPVAVLIRAHHERHDGKGFPDGLQGHDIALGARILAVADAFDDLQSGHLGAALSVAEARTILLRGRGTQFDPETVDVFLQTELQATPAVAAPGVSVSSADLRPGMVLDCELRSVEGVMLLAAGHALTADLIARIRQYEAREGLTLVLRVRPHRKA